MYFARVLRLAIRAFWRDRVGVVAARSSSTLEARAKLFLLGHLVALTLAPVLNARWMATNVFTERYSIAICGFCALLAGFVFLFS